MSVVTSVYRFSGSGEDFGPRANGMVTLHTWEGPYNALTVADGIELLKWQDDGTVLGSYNRVCCVDGVISSVPDGHASGGINPGSAAWAPKPWLYGFLDANEIANPNYFTLNLVALGSRSWFDANGWLPEIIDGFARSILEEEKRIGGPVVVTNHSDFQTNRTDAGQIAIDLTMARYQQLTAKPEDDMPSLTSYALERITLDVNANVRAAPSGTAMILFRTTAQSDAVRVGTIVNAEGTWSVFWQGSRKVWAYTVAQNVLKASPLPMTVPSDCTALIAEAVASFQQRITAGKEAAVQIGEVAKALETVLG